MLEIEQRPIQFRKEFAERGEEFCRMRFGFGERLPGKVSKKPDKTRGAVLKLFARKQLPLGVRSHAGKRKLRSTLRNMHERAALHVDERLFACRMRDFQHKATRI